MKRTAREIHFHATDDRKAVEMVVYATTSERMYLLITPGNALVAAEDLRMVAEALLGATDPARDAA